MFWRPRVGDGHKKFRRKKTTKKWILCSSRKNPYPPQGRSSEIHKGRGLLKAKILEARYEAELEFPEGGGGGVRTKNPSMGGVWIISGTALLKVVSHTQWPLMKTTYQKVILG